MIQHMRYKNTYSIEAEDEVLGLATFQLILQPMVENAIYHGMQFMDGDGEIKIRAWKENNDLYLSVEDNGLGMTEEQVERLFTDTSHVPSSADIFVLCKERKMRGSICILEKTMVFP